MDAEQIAEGRRRWQERYDAARKSERDYTTLSGVEVEPLYGPAEADADARFERIGWPGEYPFTRGISRSQTITAGRCFSASSIPCSPSSACHTSQPASCSPLAAGFRQYSSSSIRRIVFIN